ncbi:hypothetical protein T439DRAFT_377444 [Meredithblackwellia eburnea MCA 4105]
MKRRYSSIKAQSTDGKQHQPSTLHSFPGLVSALRPVRRTTATLKEELALLRRFTYKNKNQHKGSGWWKKVIEVNRCLIRTEEELDGLLGEFGWSTQEKDDGVRIHQEQALAGLLRLSRSFAIVGKLNAITLNCTSSLDQLIETRAFLPFSLTLMSLVARVFTLSEVLRSSLQSLASVLVEFIPLFSTSQDQAEFMKTLPRLFSLRSLGEDTKSSSRMSPAQQTPASIPSPPPFQLPAESDNIDDIGAVVRRPAAQTPAQPHFVPISDQQPHVSVPRYPELDVETMDVDSGSTKEDSRPPTIVPRPEKIKKKKKRKKGGDEIDDIFG